LVTVWYGSLSQKYDRAAIHEGWAGAKIRNKKGCGAHARIIRQLGQQFCILAIKLLSKAFLENCTFLSFLTP